MKQERTIKKGMVAVMAVLLMAACSPRAVVDLYTMEYAPTATDSVRVFGQGEQLPPHTLAIGEVRVTNGGVAKAGDYERLLRIAVEKTASSGGNGFVITEHRVPDFWSSVHRVRGTLLRLPQTWGGQLAQAAHDSLTWEGSAAPTASIGSPAVQAMTNPPAAQQQWEQATDRQDSRRQAGVRQDVRQTTDVLRVSIGPSWLTSKYQLGNHLYKSRCGLDLSFDYDHVWPSGFGFGINYRHDYTPFDEGVVMRTNFIGPSFVIASPPGGIRYDMAIGYGYCWYSEHYRGYSATEGHLAPLMRLGVEFSISERAAIGFQMNMLSIHLDEPEGLELKKDEFYGIQRIGLQLGVRFYL